MQVSVAEAMAALLVIILQVFGGSRSGSPFGILTFSCEEAAKGAKALLTNARMKLDISGEGNPEPHGKDLAVLWALQTATLALDHLTAATTASVLQSGFSQFGKVVDQGVSPHPLHTPTEPLATGKGWVTFDRKYSAAVVLDICSEGMFMQGTSLCPVSVSMPSAPVACPTNPLPCTESAPPVPAHFAAPGTLDYEFAVQHRELAERQYQERLDLLVALRQRQQALLEQHMAAIHKSQSIHTFLLGCEREARDTVRRLERKQRQAPPASARPPPSDTVFTAPDHDSGLLFMAEAASGVLEGVAQPGGLGPALGSGADMQGQYPASSHPHDPRSRRL